MYVVITVDFSFAFFNFTNKTLFLLFCVINSYISVSAFRVNNFFLKKVFKSLPGKKPVGSKYSVLMYLKIVLF